MSLIIRCLVACTASIGFLIITSHSGAGLAPGAPAVPEAGKPAVTNTAMAGRNP